MLSTARDDPETSQQHRESTERPPLPDGLETVDLGANGRQVLEKRFIRRGEHGQPTETVEEMFWRVAFHVAEAEAEWGDDVLECAKVFYDLMASKRFMPNSPTFTGAGTPLGQLAACFVLPIDDDMGKSESGIFQTLRDAALIQQTGGGNGFSFSSLRPHGSLVHSSAGRATGPVGFLRVYDKAFGEVAQGGTRRGANMAVLRVDHPDIREFIRCKTDENQITNFNISVGLTDEFMRAVSDGEDFELRAPHTGEVTDTVPAREIFDLIVKQAHHNGEPGVLFLDTANRSNPVAHLYQLETTNPCGEQWLGPYENCCLGSVNLAKHFGPNGTVDWDQLRQTIVTATRFLDDVVSANAYVEAVPQLKQAAMRARRIGLGIMGLGDLMYHVGVRYGSEEGQEFAGQLMEFVRFHCMLASIELAHDRGAFPAIKGSIYDPEDMTWQAPTPLFECSREFQRPELVWEEVLAGIREHGIRNAAQTTIAPTGTIATVAGCESYGCEPVFALAYDRHVDDAGKDLTLSYTSPLFMQALTEAGLDPATQELISRQVADKGSCSGIPEVPEEIQEVFVVSQEITADEHVLMQSALQRFVDNSLSKTCNFPEDADESQIAQAYKLAWELGCKGLTVYVSGSRQREVLETKQTVLKKATRDATTVQLPIWYESKKPRPQRLDGCTFQVNTPVGKAFVTINEKGSSQPFEVFITTAKAGSETAAVSEAIGRLISYVLRIASPVPPRERMAELVRQLVGIGGGRPLGFGPNRVLSLPDGLAQALAAYLGNMPHEVELTDIENESIDQYALRVGDLCPECGAAAVVHEEGCRKCYGCGFTEC